ncbi:DUF6538 domain-containing protein [Brevundimonas sp.]|uniref:DUF6538 domain-containing protein n=1 Tax=Brevundimonas sp. TaxID=1871086 RepID=UPI003D113A45
MWRSGRLYYRQRVPTSLLSIVGRREIWGSLGTDSPTVALRRSHKVAAQTGPQYGTGGEVSPQTPRSTSAIARRSRAPIGIA